MRVLVQNVHTGYDYERSKTGHEFFALRNHLPWNETDRPMPANWHLVDDLTGPYDVAIASTQHSFEQLKGADCPIILEVVADCSEGDVPRSIEERASAVVFLSRDVADRWTLENPRKKRVIELGVDASVFYPRQGTGPEEILTVGHSMPKRWDKGHAQLACLSTVMPCTVAGPENEAYSGAIGAVAFDQLLGLYQRAKVYFNPGPLINISVIEAMMAGCPVVSFRPINLSDLIVHGMNGFIVDTVDGAQICIHALLKDENLRQRLGQAAQRIARERFGLKLWKARWDALMERAVRDWKQERAVVARP